MFCPKCGAKNNSDTRYCRACGENLFVISQALNRRLPVILASKLDAYIERKNERIRRDSISSAIFSTMFLIIAIKDLASGSTTIGGAAWLIAFAMLGYVWSIWDYLAYKRSLSNDRANFSEPSAATSNEQRQSDYEKIEAPASISENTTRIIDRDEKTRIDNV